VRTSAVAGALWVCALHASSPPPITSSPNSSRAQTHPLLSLHAGTRRSLVVRAFKVEEAREQLKDSYAETASSATATAQELADKALTFWEESEQKPTLIAIGAGALVALYLVDAVVSAVSRVPVLSTTMELVGLGFTAFTAYRWFFVDGEKSAIVGEVKGFAAKVGLDL
jgi:hypothetical protein